MFPLKLRCKCHILETSFTIEIADIMRVSQRLPQATSASHGEVLRFIDREVLFGRGIGYVDAHLLAATRLTAGSKLWTRDRRLHAVAAQLGLAATLSH